MHSLMLRRIVREKNGVEMHDERGFVYDRADAIKVAKKLGKGAYVIFEKYGPASYDQRQWGETIHV